MPIDRQRLVMICCSDIAGQVRGKGFPAGELESRRRFGVGWTPTNVMINCFGRIPATPFGALGDLMLVSDAATETVLDFGDGMPVEHFLLGDILTLDGRPWECCLRCTLRRTLEALEQEAGLRLYASFEHEFHLFGATTRPGASYALSALRGVEPFIGDFLGALDSAGLEPDTFLPEYGPQQFEVTVRPAFGIEAADRAVRLREICRAVARRHGLQASFAPLVSYGVVGNGVHIHFSLTDREGKPVTYDPGGPGGLSAAAGSFAAGILRHSRALCAVTAPSVPSYERLKPLPGRPIMPISACATGKRSCASAPCPKSAMSIRRHATIWNTGPPTRRPAPISSSPCSCGPAWKVCATGCRYRRSPTWIRGR